MDYAASVQFLYQLTNERRTLKLGLKRITRLLQELGRPQDAYRTVHIAGTNGKGSTAAMIEAALRAAGVRTGLYTSPHLVEPTERVRIAGEPVSPDQFAAAFDVVHAAAERLLAAGEIDGEPTYFEMVTAMAFVLFQDCAVDTAVIEVGLGGRLDATNVITPAVSVLTPIGFDHMEFLGDTLSQIAGEKAGILKPGIPVVAAAQEPEAEAVFEQRARELACPYTPATAWRLANVQVHERGSRFHAVGPARLEITCPLAGAHQVQNALTAASALTVLGLEPRRIEAGIATARWPGRLEWFDSPAPGGLPVLLDGAHNAAGALALARYLRQFVLPRPIRLIFGVMRDKDVAAMTGVLCPLAAEVILVAPDSARAYPPEQLARELSHPLVRTAASVADALAKVRIPGAEGVILVAGSLFLVGEARRLLTSS